MGGSGGEDGDLGKSMGRHESDFIPDTFEMTPELRERVDTAWITFKLDPGFAVSMAQAASQLLARRGDLPHAYRRGKPSDKS
jgi:hypothetical protein